MHQVAFSPIAWALHGDDVAPVVVMLDESVYVVMDYLGQDLDGDTIESRMFDNISDALTMAMELAHDEEWQMTWKH